MKKEKIMIMMNKTKVLPRTRKREGGVRVRGKGEEEEDAAWRTGRFGLVLLGFNASATARVISRR